jgi:hypothetical protein
VLRTTRSVIAWFSLTSDCVMWSNARQGTRQSWHFFPLKETARLQSTCEELRRRMRCALFVEFQSEEDLAKSATRSRHPATNGS